MSKESELKADVLAELTWEPSVTVAHIGVAVHEGVVTLMGHVPSYAEKHAAETAAGRVKGVKAVVEKIEVKLASSVQHGDEEIAAAAVHRLAWNTIVQDKHIKIKVEKGWVTLTGQVDWGFQKEAVAQDLRWLSGVIGVSNTITIKPRVDVENLDDDIMDALGRSWLYEPDAITVTADGGKIKLSGKVGSWHDREMITATAWAAPGATAVENHISVV
jgi:osmotically-inducible protein OsmY